MNFTSLKESYIPARSHICAEVRDKNGNLKQRIVGHNLRTNVGASVIAVRLGSTSGNPFNYIGLTTNSAAASTTDSTLTSELSASGLTRTIAATFTNNAPSTNSITTLAGSYTLTVSFTFTGSTSQVIAKIAAFDAASNGNMGFESLLPSTATLNSNGDVLNVTWVFNF